jgi:hypothetical protein
VKRPIVLLALLAGAACQPAQAPVASADECPEIPEVPRTDVPECDRAWRVSWCWIGKTGQSEDYQAGLRDGFDNYRVDAPDPMPREQVRQACIDVLEKRRETFETEGCWVGACVE